MRESVLLIGGGAIGMGVIKKLANDRHVKIKQLLVRPGQKMLVSKEVGDGVSIISSIGELSHAPDFVLECASHSAVEQFGPYFLEKGIDFGVVSVGALADQNLLRRLERASETGQAQLLIIPGAIAGIDALAAVGTENLEEVIYTSRKPPLSWSGTPADGKFDLIKIKEATVIFKGSARQAASLYPKNANVAATVALAGLGFERTQVTLIADPNAKGNIHQLEAIGSFGKLNLTVVGDPLPNNPKSSALTCFSAVRTIKNRTQHIYL